METQATARWQSRPLLEGSEELSLRNRPIMLQDVELNSPCPMGQEPEQELGQEHKETALVGCTGKLLTILWFRRGSDDGSEASWFNKAKRLWRRSRVQPSKEAVAEASRENSARILSFQAREFSFEASGSQQEDSSTPGSEFFTELESSSVWRGRFKSLQERGQEQENKPKAPAPLPSLACANSNLVPLWQRRMMAPIPSLNL